MQKHLQESETKQVSIVEHDARLLSECGQTLAGYNVRIAVDAKHKLIIAEAVTQDGNESQQLMPIID